MAEKDAFSFESIFEGLKEGLKKLMPSSVTGGVSWFFDWLKGLLGPFAAFLPSVTEKIDEFKDMALDKSQDLVAAVDKDLVSARKGTETAIDTLFTNNETKLRQLGLKGDTFETVKKETQRIAAEFYANGVPELAKDGTPLAAYDAAVQYRAQLYNALAVGDGKTNVGLLDVNMKNRDAAAQWLATILSGVEATDTASTLAANPRTTGLSAMLAKTMKTIHAEGFEKDSFNEADVTMPAPPALLVKKQQSTTVSGGKDVESNEAPAPTTTKSKPKTLVIK